MDNKEILAGITAVGDNLDKFKTEIAEVKKQNLDLSQEVDTLKKQNGKLGIGGSGGTQITYATIIRKIISDNYDSIKGMDAGQAMRIGSAKREEVKQMLDQMSAPEVKTMTTGASLTGSVYANNIQTTPVRPYFATHIRDIIPIYQSTTGSVLYPQETASLFVAGSGSFGSPGEGNTKPVLDYALKTVALTLNYIAGMARVSREMLADLPWLMSYLSNSLIEDFLQREDATYFPLLTAGALTGTTSETLAAAKALDYFAQVWGVGRKVTAALVSPSGLVNILKTKPNDYSIPGGVSYDQYGNAQIMGVPLVPCPFMTGSTILAGNFAGGAGIAVADDMNLRSTEFDGNNFSLNLVSFRMEAREGLMIFSPKSFVYGTI